MNLAAAVAEQRARREALKLLSDEALIRAHLEGEERASEVIRDRWWGPMMNFAMQRVCHKETAEDLVQETFFRIFKHAAKFSGERAKFSTWIFTIEKNLIINERRNRTRRKARSFDESVEEGRLFSSPLLQPDEELELKETLDKATLEILLLPERQRSALLLRGIHGLEYNSVAEAMGVELGTAKSRISRAREAVSQRMRAHLN